jgi:transcriptional regulator with XRE-family HTH domain
MLRQAREDAGLRQVDLAARLKRSQSYVTKYEAGERRLDLYELGAVCGALGVSLIEFVGRYRPKA